MIEGVTLEQLRTLRAVVEAGSFSAAARSLGRVQAAVSQTIDRLEAQLGLRLFDRSGRAPRLTKHGAAIAAAAAEVQGELSVLDELVKSLREGKETTLSIVVDAMFPTSSLVDFAKDVAAEHPAVELLLSTETLSAVTACVRGKHATLGIAVEDADMTGLERKHVVSVRLVPVAAPSHPLARAKRSIGATALSKAVQIVLGERRREGGTATKDQGVLSTKTWRVLDLATKHALIAGGLGWGHLPEHVVRDDLDHGRLVELRLDAWGPDALTRSLEIVSRRGAVLSPVARWAETHLSELCREAVRQAREGAARSQPT